MRKTGSEPEQQRGRDMCHAAFRQTLDLLKVTDEALADLCHQCHRNLDQDALVLRALNEMALEDEEGPTRTPGHVLLVHGADGAMVGTVYRSEPSGYRAVGEPIQLRPGESYAVLAGSEAALRSNQEEEQEGLAAYQERFHEDVRRAIGEPIRNFITYRIAGTLPGAIVAFNYPRGATRYEAQVLAALAITLGSVWTLASRVADVEEAFLYLIGALARASEVNDEVTGDHILRVSRYAEALAQATGFTRDEARTLGYSAQLHDVGKIHTPSQILRKAGPLDPEETRVMRQHALAGEKIIGASPRLVMARRIAGGHHENWDGSGYPRGLAGDAIPREARIVKVVDIYDALRSERPYKPPLSHDEACRIIVRGDERIDPRRHFDPSVLQAFCDIHGEFQLIHAEIQPWS